MSENEITSDTRGKLRKIVEGVTFSDPLVFITEFFQNSYRAKAKRMDIVLNKEEGYLCFSDDGKGLKKASDLLTLDYSCWDSTDEGFGIGFWSWLAITNGGEIKLDVECEIRSNSIGKKMSKLKILNGVLKPDDIPLSNPEPGFTAILRSELFKDEEFNRKLQERIFKDGELMPYDVRFNYCLIPPKDLRADVEGVFVKDFDTRSFKARLTLGRSYDYVKLYYEKREVGDFYLGGYIKGVIELGKSCLNLREPDRKDFARDDKFYEFKHRVANCVQELYKGFLEVADTEQLEEFAEAISNVLTIKDYEKFLEIDDILFEKKEETRSLPVSDEVAMYNSSVEQLNQMLTASTEETQLALFDQESDAVDHKNIVQILNTVDASNEYQWVNTGEINSNEGYWIKDELSEEDIIRADELVINGTVFKKLNRDQLESFTRDDEDNTYDIIVQTVKKQRKKQNLTQVINHARRKVWLKASELEEYEDLVAKARYYNIKVFVAKNVLYENVFMAKNIAHITEIKNGIQKRSIIKDVELKTDKERRMIELLQPICKFYNLPYNTFLIGNLEMHIETRLKDIVVDREILRNTKETIKIWALTNEAEKQIILDRRALGLRRFHFSNVTDFGKNELKAVMACINTLAHELSHLRYGTTDATVDHFQHQEQIIDELADLYVTL